MSQALKTVVHPLIVAAGVGKRFGSDTPKQYTRIHDKTVLEHSVAALSKIPDFSQCYLVISKEDTFAKQLSFAMPIRWVAGGAERMHSVCNGVQAIWQDVQAHNLQPQRLDDLAACEHWVLIHDAARPCVRPQDIERLIEHTTPHPLGQTAGGLLAVPVRDTVKQSQHIDAQNFSQTTIDRNTLWLAQTPQLFPLVGLYQYLAQAMNEQIAFTDEASLFEHFGHMPLLIEGQHSNIKLTFPEDLLIAQALLASD